MILFLRGKKTYIIVILSLIYVGIGLYLKNLSFAQAIQIIQVALAAGGLRAAISGK